MIEKKQQLVCSCPYRRMLCRDPGDRFVNVPLCTYELYALKSITFNFLHFHIFFGCPESGNSSTQPQDMALLFPSLSCSPVPHALPPHNTRCMGIRQRRRTHSPNTKSAILPAHLLWLLFSYSATPEVITSA